MWGPRNWESAYVASQWLVNNFSSVIRPRIRLFVEIYKCGLDENQSSDLGWELVLEKYAFGFCSRCPVESRRHSCENQWR